MKIPALIPVFCAFLCCTAALNPRGNDFREERTTELGDFSQGDVQEGGSTPSARDRFESSPRFESRKPKGEHLVRDVGYEVNPQLQAQVSFAKNMLYGRQKRDAADNGKLSQTTETPKKISKPSSRNFKATESTR